MVEAYSWSSDWLITAKNLGEAQKLGAEGEFGKIVSEFFWIFEIVAPTHFGKPFLHRFCFLRRDGLDDTEDTFEVSGCCLTTFAIWSKHFNRGTNCTPLGIEFEVTSTHSLDVLLDIIAIG